MYPSRISIKTKQTIEIENCPKSSLIKIAGLKPTIDGQKHVISVFLVFVSLDQSVFYRCLLVKPGTSCHIGFVSVFSGLFLQKFAKTTEYIEANLSRFQRFIMVQPCSFHPFFLCLVLRCLLQQSYCWQHSTPPFLLRGWDPTKEWKPFAKSMEQPKHLKCTLGMPKKVSSDKFLPFCSIFSNTCDENNSS